MPPGKLTVDDQAYIMHWSKRMAHFMKMMRRANLYILTLPREPYLAAYDNVLKSGLVAGEEQGQGNVVKKTSWQPRREDRESYLDWAQGLIDSHPLASPKNAAVMFLASNAGAMCIMKIVTDKSSRVQDRFWKEVHKLNNYDLEVTREERFMLAGKRDSRAPLPATGEEDEDGANDSIDKDSDENPTYEPFIRNRPEPRIPPVKISPRNWHEFESIGETYFIREPNNPTSLTALELSGFIHLKRGKFYEIRYEGSVDSIRITDKEFFAIIEAGMWI